MVIFLNIIKLILLLINKNLVAILETLSKYYKVWTRLIKSSVMHSMSKKLMILI